MILNEFASDVYCEILRLDRLTYAPDFNEVSRWVLSRYCEDALRKNDAYYAAREFIRTTPHEAAEVAA